MTENKRFELTMNGNEVAQYEIIDHNQKNLTVYNDLGNVYFSSAMKVCELLNELHEENEQLKKKVEDLEFSLRTELAFKRTEKEEHSDSVYDFQKKIEQW